MLKIQEQREIAVEARGVRREERDVTGEERGERREAREINKQAGEMDYSEKRDQRGGRSARAHATAGGALPRLR